ncbi:phosphoribosylaminoimidazolesuccinocarboxamide synthase [Mesohalobacter halotolerans]|uniref:Phosphoribosylaminoimidazole-succinocarboxamide synthase n=1 Tax=Mesohalobacter halotolerans TaxID=1883405 RepID=A0A4U5TQH6_9FLAO|nr:phosphoribosylaminoimidazolesuccinocarboxamide synthase [Mesohalobacter halotolerans]MBS3739725.1 phosphoribosylaminoimidazolesuccinocarboxamide synthase [Psychroflexus sp.]TKS56286.1 phosphoribosylaminoimidazolesuccinocarboxamide synthase [Mesohalobacter halotolerans]
MTQSLIKPNFKFPNQTAFYQGKVRNVYTINDDILIIIATDRLSAFDVVLPQGIPHKGQILNQLATYMLDKTQHEVPNWLIASPHPNVSIGLKCKPFKVEMVVRQYLTGHAYREYKAGKRELCGVKLPNGMKEHDKFEQPIITPTTKAEQGDHDQDISKAEILDQNIVSEEDYKTLEEYSLKLFEMGATLAKSRDLLLVDTKYEFGKTTDGKIVVIDEIHTPDSSRYFYADTYQELQDKGKKQKQLSKEFVREWLMEQGFQGKTGQNIPDLPHEFISHVSDRYIELYEKITAQTFKPMAYGTIENDIQDAVLNFLKQ